MITSAHHPLARRVAEVLRTPPADQRTIVIDDVENIAQAVACGIRLDAVYVADTLGDVVLPPGASRATPVHRISARASTALFGVDKRARVFALAPRPAPATLEDLLHRDGDVVVLDGVRLAGNIGAVTRSACALGAAGVVLLDSRLASTMDRRLIRASRGLVFALPVVLSTREDLAAFVRRHGIPVVGLGAGASAPLRAIGAVRERVAIVAGSERAGLSAEVGSLAAHNYAIPMDPRVESFNVSVATAIALYERRCGNRR
ncbi:TrmH family RNA methyltransferase [Georgenia faecalis]|uniref:TrmH family RNA methyltransferase n=1 Tax=Georgenia faecalis TaxID=2483799 RepID=A0ABV9DAV8_9MICO|nr:TrmH family RNA methyltransferase [Georgenia faecalis]